MRVGKKRAELVKKCVFKTAIAHAIGISPKHIHRISLLDQKDEQLKGAIGEVHKTHTAYGHRRVALHLKINHKRVNRVMKKFGIKAPRRKIHRFCTQSTSNHAYTNLFRDMIASKPNQVWCADVSFISFQGRWWYLSTIEDVCTRQVLAAQVGKFHNAQLVLTTIKQAIKNAGTIPDIFHTDQGTEFLAKAITDYVEAKGTHVSVSDKASPWQNGYKESFFGKFKDEFGDFNRFETISELIEEIYSQIHYYNTERIHTILKMPPVMYAQLLIENSLPKWGT